MTLIEHRLAPFRFGNVPFPLSSSMEPVPRTARFGSTSSIHASSNGTVCITRYHRDTFLLFSTADPISPVRIIPTMALARRCARGDKWRAIPSFPPLTPSLRILPRSTSSSHRRLGGGEPGAPGDGRRTPNKRRVTPLTSSEGRELRPRSSAREIGGNAITRKRKKKNFISSSRARLNVLLRTLF